MFLIMFAAIPAGLLTMSVTASSSLLLALMAGPVVGSAAGLCAALIQAWRSGSSSKNYDDLNLQTDTMVSALRCLAARGHVVDTALDNHASNTPHAAYRASRKAVND